MIISGLLKSQVSTDIPEKRRLAGIVSVNSVGASRRVVIQKRGSLEYVASTYSEADGSWELRGMPEMPERSLLVEIIDDTGNFDPITFDNVSQVE